MKKYNLEIIVFLCGAVVMVLELVGSRILAPYLGTSIIVWTSLIGIILGSLSLGYWCGGRVADKKPDYRTFSAIILLAGVLVGSIAFVKSFVLEWLQNTVSNIQLSAPLATLVLFGLPSVLLGMIAPYAVRLKIEDVKHSGATVGNLYAISTIGSIAGTFLAGYYLIAWFGSTKILIVLSIVLVLTSLLARGKGGLAIRAGLIVLLLAGMAAVDSYSAYREKNGFIDVDTRYNRVWIHRTIHKRTGRPILAMATNPGETQSAMFLDGDDDLVLNYTKFYRMARHFNPGLKESLMIGGAGYSYAKDYLKKIEGARLDVVELDPGMTAIAEKHFNLRVDERLRTIHEDGRTFLNTSTKHYDAIFSDAFTSLYTIPFQLTTKETVARMYSLLNDGGVVLVNIISAIEGDEGRFLRAEYATFKSEFPQVYLFPVSDPDNGAFAQNVMLVALKSTARPSFTSNDREMNNYLCHLWTKELSADMPLLTDEHAPVDNYIMKLAGRK